MLHDAHCHLKDDRLLAEMIKHEVHCIANAATPQEYEQLLQAQKQWKLLSISAGIHPWKVQDVVWDELLPIMQEVPFIGEIGLDNVWCQTPLALQASVFERSLAYAAHAKKPVILHIKGMEKEVLSYIKQYPNDYLLHWYSCNMYLQDYLELGCYVTIGPSVGVDEAVTQVAKLAPLDRIMLETDGIDAISWCDERTVEIPEYQSILMRSIHRIATIRNIAPEILLATMNQTFQEFVRKVEAGALI